ncbi:MAG: VWA domain-containing protein [Candidatus Omnitrophica bacterium]|nr:VWA domain-containing protein [Candidatus Omnitrophota bacterium]
MARAEMDREVRNYPSKDKFTYEVSGKLEYEESKGEEYPIDTEEIDHITGQFNTEEYARIYENKFLTAADNPLSTFSIDVDTASYSNVRRFLHNNQMPNEDSVRIEELINYFTYNYPGPEGPHPFSITIDGATCPWNKTHNLVRIGLQGKTLNENEIPASNLVFLIDVSGSMSDQNKLPLLKKAFKMMVRQLRSDQRVAIVVYAGAAGQVLDSTPGSNQHKIIRALDRLQSGGSTAGGAGIRLAYKIAQENFIPDGNNRIILATDGDFNIGISSTSEMTRLIEKKREQGIFLTVLGFGMGNYKDNRLEQIADKGNGTYYYIDTEQEAKKVLVHELGSTLFTIAKDVKLQIEFNPTQVKAYRLIGYENRMLAKEDFNDDTKDAGELGAGHTVTAFYEIVPADAKETFKAVDPLKYQQTQVVNSEDLMTVKFRYKDPAGHKSKLISQTINKTEIENHLTNDFQFAASVAEFGLILRQSKFRAQASYQSVLNAAKGSKGQDPFGYRQEFIDLVKKAQRLDTRTDEPLDDTNPEGGFFFKGK